MSKSIRYIGEFAAIGGHEIRVEILKEGEAPFIDMLTFPADAPVVIEWADADKLEPCLSSSCTLKLESMTDRQFLDELYTEEAGSVMLKVYRDGDLYWSGSLDSEQYEEPYSFGRNYDVTVAFQDFAVLDRIKYDRTDNVPVKTLIEWIIAQSGVEYGSIVWKTSTQTSTGANTAFTSSYVKSANWYDEEGEASTLREVLDETLKVFCLRVKQKAGNIYVYDLNQLYSETPSQIVWDGTDAMIAADKIYNDVEVTWSPYDNATLFESEFDVASNATAAQTIQFLQNDTLSENGLYAINSLPNGSTESMVKDWWNRYISYSGQNVYPIKNREGFALAVYNSVEGVTLGGAAKFFRITPQYSGQDDEGILLFIGSFDIRVNPTWHNNLRAGLFGAVQGYAAAGNNAMTFARFYVPTISSNRAGYYLKLEVETLIDTRVNPYETNVMTQSDRINVIDHIYIPYNLRLESDDGNTYYWDTSAVINSNDTEVSVRSAAAEWKQSGQQGRVFSASAYSAALHYTSRISDPTEADANLGWTTNTVMMPRHSTVVSDSVQSMGSGEFIPLPVTGGWVTLTISDIIDSSDVRGRYEHYINDFLGWLAFKSVRLSIVDKYGHDIKTSDIVTRATLNKSAKEELTVDTLLDVGGSVTNIAKGMLVDVNGTPLSGFRRAGSSGTLAKLMCNTIYSQYATRHMAISGTAELIGTPCILSEQNTEGKFILEGESQDMRENTSLVRMVQFFPDSYISTDEDTVITAFQIRKNLAGVVLGNNVASVQSGDSYTTTVTAVSGFTLDTVEVTMGGTDITSTAYNSSTHTISIASVTGIVVITAFAKGAVGTTLGKFIPRDYADGMDTVDGERFYVIINKE